MDLSKVLQDLYAEKEKLERVIGLLEELQRTAASVPVLAKPVEERGRKSMGSSERQEVSERMRRYWASRRQAENEQKTASPPTPAPPTPPSDGAGPPPSKSRKPKN